MQIEMRQRSRIGRLSPDGWLRTLPGEGRVLGAVRPADVIPRETEGVNVTPRWVSDREPVGGRVSGVLEVDRFVSLWADPNDTGSAHLDRAGGLDRPFVPLPVEVNLS